MRRPVAVLEGQVKILSPRREWRPAEPYTQGLADESPSRSSASKKRSLLPVYRAPPAAVRVEVKEFSPVLRAPPPDAASPRISSERKMRCTLTFLRSSKQLLCLRQRYASRDVARKKQKSAIFSAIPRARYLILAAGLRTPRRWGSPVPELFHPHASPLGLSCARVVSPHSSLSPV